MAQGEFALVRELLEKAIHKRSVLVGDHDVYAVLADAAVQQQDQAALRKYAFLLEEAAGALDHKLYLATAHRAWGVAHRLGGEFKQAEARLEQAIPLFRGLDTRWQLGRTHLELGHLAAEQSRTAAAKQHYSQALERFEELGAGPDVAQAREWLSIRTSEL